MRDTHTRQKQQLVLVCMRMWFCEENGNYQQFLSSVFVFPSIHVCTGFIIITKYGSTIGMDEVFHHHPHTFEKSNLNFQFQF